MTLPTSSHQYVTHFQTTMHIWFQKILRNYSLNLSRDDDQHTHCSPMEEWHTRTT